MRCILIAALALAGQIKAEPDQFPLALQRSMELDDLDREIQRVHDAAVMKRAQFAASERLAKRGLVSRSDLERETADLRFQEAREAELVASRAIKVYERDVKGKAAAPDDQKAYALLLDWARKQLAIYQVDSDFQAAQLKRTRALFGRNAASRQELDDAELAFNAAQAGLSFGLAREAQILMELAARCNGKRSDPDEVYRLKSDYLKARIRYFEVASEGAKRRLELARERSRLGLMKPQDVSAFERAAADAAASLDSERKALERHETEGRTEPRKRSA